MIDNMFVPEVSAAPTPTGDSDGDSTVAHNCTGCEENVAASSFCTDCSEWLCEPCAQAHRRVKVTKDHNVESIGQLSASATGSSSNLLATSGMSKRRSLMCPTHPNELLKLYCETCVKLTCRDCQLAEHRDHKYQFVQRPKPCGFAASDLYAYGQQQQTTMHVLDLSPRSKVKRGLQSLREAGCLTGSQWLENMEAAVACRTQLQSWLTKIREKQSHIENAKSLIDRRHTEITQKERTVANEIKSHALSLISQINQKGRQVIGELQAVCNAKRRQLDQKNTEIRLLSDNLRHGLRFAEYLLTLSDDAALLYSRRTLMHQLSAILRTRCEVPNPYHVVDLRFNSSQLVSGSHWSLGTLVVDGYQYGHRGQAVPPTPVTNGRVTSSSQHGYFSASTASRGEPVQQMSGEQKLQKLQMMLQMRRLDQQRIVPKQATAAGPLMKPPDYPCGGGVVACASSYPSHMPNQSSNISSSNQHRQDLSGSYAVQTGYVPAVHAKNYTPQHSISLAQLRDDQHQRMQNHQEQVSTTLQPIVIQPTNLPDQMTSPSPGSSTDIRFGYKQDNCHKNLSSSSATTPPTASQSSPSVCKLDDKSPLAMLLDIKKESEALEMDFRGDTNPMPRSRTPTPQIESTSQELGDSPNASVTCAAALSPAVSDGQCVKYNTGELSDTPAALTSDGMFPVRNDDAFSSEAGDLSGALTGWQDIKDSSKAESSENVTINGNQSVNNSQSCSQQTTASVDPNEDYCAVCRNGGDLLCCDNCPRVYHLPCHVPAIASFPSDNATWSCTLCATDEDSVCLEAPDIRPGITTGKRRSTSTGLTDRELRVCERLLLDLLTFPSSSPFHVPVSKSIPNYYKIIVTPMDLGTIRSYLSKTHFNYYQSVEEFVADVQLVFTNCATFNPPDSEIGKAGIATHEYFLSRLARLLPYIDLQATAAVTEQLPRPVKRRKPNPKSSKGSPVDEQVPPTTVNEEANNAEAGDNN